jgi:hypothetical protein
MLKMSLVKISLLISKIPKFSETWLLLPMTSWNLNQRLKRSKKFYTIAAQWHHIYVFTYPMANVNIFRTSHSYRVTSLLEYAMFSLHSCFSMYCDALFPHTLQIYIICKYDFYNKFHSEIYLSCSSFHKLKLSFPKIGVDGHSKFSQMVTQNLQSTRNLDYPILWTYTST